jgi:hypothetical protein
MFSGRISRSYSDSDTRCVIHVNNPMTSHIRWQLTNEEGTVFDYDKRNIFVVICDAEHLIP